MFVAVCFRAASQEKFEEYKKQVEEKGANTQVQQMLSDLAKPTEKVYFTMHTHPTHMLSIGYTMH